MSRWSILLGVVAAVLAGTEARGHFLFLRVGPPAEGGRRVEVFFSEQADAGDPKFVPKIAAGTRLWAQAEPGRFQPVSCRTGEDRLIARVPQSGSIGLIGVCDYGVLARPNQKPFLLRYYPKALAGRPDELNRLERRPEIPFEIQARIQDGRVELAALRDGRPVPRTTFHIVNLDLEEQTCEAGPDGTAAWSPQAPSRYAIYTREDLKETGTYAGQPYEEVREFATLTLDWPLARSDCDPEAVSLFEKALQARAQWAAFPGFSARMTGHLDGRDFEGKVVVAADGAVHVETEDTEARAWIEDQLGSIVLHRLPAAHEGPRPVLRFADNDAGHPLGRLLLFDGGRFASSYRIQGDAITVVNRALGRTNLTIRTLDHDRNPEGRLLPRSYVVQTWDASTGALKAVETVEDRWVRVAAFDLPARHTVTTTSDAGFQARGVWFAEHQLGPAK